MSGYTHHANRTSTWTSSTRRLIILLSIMILGVAICCAAYSRTSEKLYSWLVKMNQRKGPSPEESLKVAIVCTTSHPSDIKTWLAYHLDVVGVDKIFLEIQDNPSLSLEVYPYTPRVEMTHTDAFSSFEEECLSTCRQTGITFVIYMDTEAYIIVDSQYNHKIHTLMEARNWKSNTEFQTFLLKEMVALEAHFPMYSSIFYESRRRRRMCRVRDLDEDSSTYVSQEDQTLNIRQNECIVVHFRTGHFQNALQTMQRVMGLDSVKDLLDIPYYKNSLALVEQCPKKCARSTNVVCDSCTLYMNNVWKHCLMSLDESRIHHRPITVPC